MNPWEPTHRITLNGDTTYVQFCPEPDGGGPAYTEEEWESETPADWEVTPAGDWLFQGDVPLGECQVDETERPGPFRFTSRHNKEEI